MSQENVEIAQRLIAAFNAGDLEAMVELAHPEIEIIPLRAALEEESYNGREEMPEFWKDMMEAWEEGLHVDVHATRGVGERVVALGLLVGRGTASGADVEAELGWVMSVRDGKVASLRTYADAAGALEAAGLSE